MAATIEALLEENLARVQELETTSESLKAAITEHLVPLDDQVTSDVIPTVTAAVERMQSFQELLSRVEQSFESAAQQADGKLATLAEAVQSVDEKTVEVEQTTETILNELETESNKVLRAVQSNDDSIREELTQLQTNADALGTLVVEKKDAATSSAQNYMDGVTAAFEKLESDRDSLTSRLEESQQEHASRLEAAKTGLENSLTDAKTQLDAAIADLRSELTTQYQTVEVSNGGKIADLVKEHADNAVETLQGADVDYQEAVRNLETKLNEIDGEADRALEEIKAAAPPIDKIQTEL